MTDRATVIRGAGLMTLAAVSFGIMSTLIRLGSEELHPFQIAFFRNFFGAMVMIPWLVRGGFRTLKTERIGLYWCRGFLGAATMLAFFWTITVMPLAEVVSLSFTAPLFVTAGAALILHETVGLKRWMATLIGFAGTLVILRPGVNAITLPALVVIASAAAMAGSILIIKVLSRTEDSNAIVMYMGLMMTPITLVAALFVWQWPTAQGWVLMIALGTAGTLGHVFFTRSVQITDASLVMPFDFVRLPVVAGLGYLVFGQSIDALTWIGAIVIFGSGAYIAHRETVRGQLPETPRSLNDP